MTFNVYYKIEKNQLVYVGLTGIPGAKKVQFESYESSIIFEDKLIRIRASNTYITEKRIKEIVKEVKA